MPAGGQITHTLNLVIKASEEKTGGSVKQRCRLD
jgi:hypothetical protein